MGDGAELCAKESVIKTKAQIKDVANNFIMLLACEFECFRFKNKDLEISLTVLPLKLFHETNQRFDACAWESIIDRGSKPADRAVTFQTV